MKNKSAIKYLQPLLKAEDLDIRKNVITTIGKIGGKEAIELIKKQQFDLVISDLFMPGADGLEVVSALQKISPKTKVVVMTAFSESEKAKEVEKILKDNFLRKPFTLTFLVNKVADLL
jgi:YesN/AraC family two-component response regulator